MGMSESKWLELKLSRKNKSFNGLFTRCCSVPEVDISLFCAQYKIINIESLMIQNKVFDYLFPMYLWEPISLWNLGMLVNSRKDYISCVIKSLVNYICVGNNPSVSPVLTNVSISLTDLMSVSCVYFLKVHCFCDLKLFNPDQIK